MSTTNEQVERSIQEIWDMFRETERKFQATDKAFIETDPCSESLHKVMRDLENKFGGFFDGMVFPSLEKILFEKFKMEYISHRSWKRKNGEFIELEVFAYANKKKKEAIIVEIKSRMQEEHVDEMLHTLNRFSHFFPEHKDKALYGIIAAEEVTEHIKQKVYKSGLYLAMIRDYTFIIDVPEKFKPKRFQ